MDNADVYSKETYFMIPAKALNSSSRQYLSLLLNIKEDIPDVLSRRLRDYRGLAELLKFDYNELRNFERHDDPTGKMLDCWQTRSDATVGQLMEFLKEMGRHDIVQDVRPNFDRDVSIYLQSRRERENPVQVPEVTSCNPIDFRPENDSDFLTIDDKMSGKLSYYDAYVCYADEDYEFVDWLVQCLERAGFKLYIPKRHLLIGLTEQDTNLRMIQERCQRMLLILSNDFVRSSACSFLASYAGALSVERQRRLLIPVVRANCNFEELKKCKDLYFLRYVSKIQLSEKHAEDWEWNRLVFSLGSNGSGKSSSQMYNMVPQLMFNVPETSNPCITFPPSLNHSSTSDHCSYVSVAASCSHALPANTQHDVSPNSSTQVKTSLSNTKKVLRSLLPKRASSKHYQSSNTSISSIATSGFHSQSGNIENSNEECLDDTPV